MVRLTQRVATTIAAAAYFVLLSAATVHPQRLAIKTWVNDELKQNTNTADMVFTTAEQVAWLSNLSRLEPGDVISTGTGAGVGRPRGTFLKPGDRVVMEIESIGRLESPVVAEPAREASVSWRA